MASNQCANLSGSAPSSSSKRPLMTAVEGTKNVDSAPEAKRVKTKKTASTATAAVSDGSGDDEAGIPDEELENLVDELPEPDWDNEHGKEEKSPFLPIPTLPNDAHRDTSSVPCPIFKHMCEKIFADDHYKHVVSYLDKNSVSKVWSFVDGLIKSNKHLKMVIEKGLWDDLPSLLAIGGEPEAVNDQGWYMDLVTDPEKSGWFKEYVGQAHNTRLRLRGHRNEVKTGRSLHYKLARVEGRLMNFVLLGRWTKAAGIPMDDALLDLVEMYFSLLFQSLPQPTLKKWLPASVPLRKEVGVNVATPLQQSVGDQLSRRQAKLEILHLRASSDAEVRSYVHCISKEAAAKGRASMAAQNWVPNSQGHRNVGWRRHVLRAPLEGNQHELVVRVRCIRCKSEKTDPDPLYQKSDGKYIVRQQVCEACPPAKVNPKTGAPNYQKVLHHPVDGRAKFTMTKIKKPQWVKDLGE